MTGAALAALGVVLIAVVLVDLWTTTLTLTGGAGPLTRRLGDGLWRVLLRAHARDSSSRVLANAGGGILVVTVLVWVTLFWAGWTLLFLSGGAISDAQTGAAASVADVVYYAGFTVSTLGVGDFTADTALWRILTSVASFSGLFLVTLAITYLLSVVSAVVSRRSLATYVQALGDTAGDIVVRGWAGDAVSSAFVQHLVTLTAQLSAVAEQHLAYPVLHYFRSRHPDDSAPVALARLDDAVLLLRAAVAPSARPDPATVDPVQRVLGSYAQAAHAASATPRTDPVPPLPDTGPLLRAGIPLADQGEWGRQASADAGRRARLARVVTDAGWSWPGS
ncbi:potassium channel family protein [Modestobacter lapidis]|nr:two pore domain potassium channel family protein [Modestobacter lapidis]